MKVVQVLKMQVRNVLPVAFLGLLPITCLSFPVKLAPQANGYTTPVFLSSPSPATSSSLLLTGSAASATGAENVAIGAGSSAAGNNSVAIGSSAAATANNAVALGSDAVANRDNTLSVGKAGTERQITDIAAGTSGTDAVNVGQLHAGIQQSENWAKNYTDQQFNVVTSQIQRTDNRSSAGVAGAMAMAGLPQAYQAGKTMAAASAGGFRNQSGVAVGVSTISESGRWVYKATGSSDSHGGDGLTIGAGLQW